MSNEHVFRLDYRKKLADISDNCHRARRWHGDSKSYPHGLLQTQLSQLGDDQAIYRICFWVSLELALKDKQNYFDGEVTLTRCAKADVLAAGFKESWDDGLNTGDAYLFWKDEQLHAENQAFSEAAISFDHFEAFVGGDWLPLTTQLQPIVSVAEKTAIVNQESKVAAQGESNKLGIFASLKAIFQKT